MTDIDQIRFMDTIHKALNRPESPRRPIEDLIQTAPNTEDTELIKIIQGRKRKDRLSLLNRMMEIGPTINTEIVAAKTEADITAAIANIAVGRNAEWGKQKSIVTWDHPLVNSLQLSTTMTPLGIPVISSQPDSGAKKEEAFRRQSETALIGVTSADFGLAETATLTMKTRAGQSLHVSLLPSIHIAVIRLEQILENFKELYTLLKWDPKQQTEGITHSMSLITGPSKTADIEATLVHGAHGPRELVIFVLV
jgi:L-lactate dehydrogenase complex protein LldG